MSTSNTNFIHLPPGLSAASPIFANATVRNALQGRMTSLTGKCERLTAKAAKEGRDLTSEEQRLFEGYNEEFLDCELELRAMDSGPNSVGASAGPKNEPNDPRPQNQHMQRSGSRTPAARAEDHGFKNFGEFALSLRNAVRGQPDNRLRIANTAEEGTGAGGGFLVPGRFADAILQDALVASGVLGRTNQLPMPNGNLSVASMDAEDHTGGANAGITLEWTGESEQLTSQTPTLKTLGLKAKKGTIMVAASNELLYDAPNADRQIRDIFAAALRYGLEDVVLNGSGAGRPLGVLSSNCLISAAKEGSQVADTIVYENLVSMFSRLHPGMVNNAVWTTNPSTLPQLLKLKFHIENVAGSENVGGTQVPVQTDQAGVYRLLGLPLVFSKALPVLGDKGDIVLGAFSEYVMGMTYDMSIDVSPHLKFDYDQTVYRLRIRLDGMPRWSGPITPVNGSTLSPFVTLAERA